MWHKWRRCFEEAAATVEMPELEKKAFKARFPNIKRLTAHDKDPGPEFWDSFPSNLSEGISPEFNPAALRTLARKLGTRNMDRDMETRGKG